MFNFRCNKKNVNQNFTTNNFSSIRLKNLKSETVGKQALSNIAGGMQSDMAL